MPVAAVRMAGGCGLPGAGAAVAASDGGGVAPGVAPPGQGPAPVRGHRPKSWAEIVGRDRAAEIVGARSWGRQAAARRVLEPPPITCTRWPTAKVGEAWMTEIV